MTSEVEVGTCDLCGQEFLRTADDCWHPFYVEKACPPEPSSNPFDVDGWQEFFEKGLAPNRPGREHWRPKADSPAAVNASAHTVQAVQEALGCKPDYVGAWYEPEECRAPDHRARWTVRGCELAVTAADAAVQIAVPEALREAAADADPWDDLHPAASWLMDRADRMEGETP
jgi:hypothetical protein